jgi:AraC-like DNA-binding protein
MQQVAREAGMSTFHFIRCFDAVFGATPHQFRIAARLDRAKQLLAAGNHSVTDVCLEVGFSSVGTFSSLFTSRLGETPSSFRRRMRPLVHVRGALPGALVPGCLSLMEHLPASALSNFQEA